MDVHEAKRLESLERNLIDKFKAAKKLGKMKSITTTPISNEPIDVTPEQRETLTLSEAKRLDELKTKLQSEFANVHDRELQSIREMEKKYEPITRAIREQKEKEIRDRELRKQNHFKQLTKFRPRVVSTPTVNRRIEIDDDETDFQPNQSMKQLMDRKVVNLGSIGASYLPRSSDNQFGIYYDENDESLKIGSEPITFDYDDIILINGKKRFHGTEGLWKLLVRKGLVKPNEYTPNDLKTYKDILLTTNAIYQKNDPSTRHPKSSSSIKWKEMIKPIWDECYDKGLLNDDVFTGSGLKEYNNYPLEYRYINNLNELINRLQFIHAEEMAGNNGFHNEKLSVVKFIHDRMIELVKKPNGLKYIVRCLSALPEHVIEGSGLLNDVINKLPFEIHAPKNWSLDTYNYCGPGTKLDERLARGDKGVNALDEACKQHDIWYRDHKNTEDRWIADKELQKAAWDRVTSVDADLNERAVGLATTGAMWLKRKLGMGLGTSMCVYK